MPKIPLIATLCCILSLSPPALAHHPTGGRVPATFAEGLLSGLAHPMIGPDHLLAVVAVGLLSLTLSGGGWLAVTFVASTLLGTGLHLARIDVPAAEVLIAGTVILFGLLVLSLRTGSYQGWLARLAPLGIITGALHGYAYGESIIGAGSSPLVAYLLGFCFIQIGVVLAVRRVAGWLSLRGISPVRQRLIAGTAVSLAGVALFAVAF